MKIISIGRNPECDIVLSDPMISRRHAVIRVYPLGKLEIVSTGGNGTKVNGNQIIPNQPYPLKRGDSVTLANVANLDWKKVPDPMKPFKYGGLGLLALCIIVCAFIFIPSWMPNNNLINASITDNQADNASNTVKKDTTETLEGPVKEIVPLELPDFKFKETKKKKNKKKKELEKEALQEDNNIEYEKTESLQNEPQNQEESENISSRY